MYLKHVILLTDAVHWSYSVPDANFVGRFAFYSNYHAGRLSAARSAGLRCRALRYAAIRPGAAHYRTRTPLSLTLWTRNTNSYGILLFTYLAQHYRTRLPPTHSIPYLMGRSLCGTLLPVLLPATFFPVAGLHYCAPAIAHRLPHGSYLVYYHSPPSSRSASYLPLTHS